jgi:hypothetical protein
VPWQEFNLQFVSNFSKIRIRGNQSGSQIQRQLRRKAVRVAQPVHSLQFPRQCCSFSINRHYCHWQFFDSSDQPLCFNFSPHSPKRVHNLAPIYRGDEHRQALAFCSLQQSRHSARSWPVIQQDQQRVCIQNILFQRPRSRSRCRSFCRKSKAAPPSFRIPRSPRMTSVSIGRSTMLLSSSSSTTMLNRVPFRSPSFRRTLDGKTTCPRELIVVVYTSVFLAVFGLISISYIKVRHSSFQKFPAVPALVSPAVQPAPPHCSHPSPVLASPR